MSNTTKQWNWFQGDILKTHTGCWIFQGQVDGRLTFSANLGLSYVRFSIKEVTDMLNCGEWIKNP